MLKVPSLKYQPSAPIALTDRTWVNQTLTCAPIWLATDLRDGNQSLFEPMSGDTKMRFFEELVQVGLKEIEVGFPAASEIDYQFIRKLIEEALIPDDVTPMVMTQAREDLIFKTVESLKGAKKAIVHVYNATAPAWREIVFGMTVEQVLALIKQHIQYLKKITDQRPETQWILEYSPETFSATELPVALMSCNTAITAWEASPERKIIINLPSTVENSTPNVFADRIEWMHRHLDRRDSVVLSVHPHNDRGTGVATAELALLAGAQRVEGCLFGNGERCGNVDLVTLALNLYTQGIHPQLDFSNINRTAKVVEACTRLPIHPRHPYVGDLVFTAFSGSHQDAIKKGFAYQAHHANVNARWQVPYLPIDPKDLGRNYASVIRVNSQSGKGGIAYLLERDYGIVMPRRLQVEFSSEVQKIVDQTETEMTSQDLFALFEKTYFSHLTDTHAKLQYLAHKVQPDRQAQSVEISVVNQGKTQIYKGRGNGPIEATIHALGLPIEVLSYEERSMGTGANAQAIAIIELMHEGQHTKFGAGIDANIVNASIKAIFSAINRFEIGL